MCDRCVADTVPERLPETDDEGIERDSSEGDEESGSSARHITLSEVIDVSDKLVVRDGTRS